MECDNCNSNIVEKSLYLINDFISNNLLNISFKFQLNNNLWINIFKYLINFNGHKVIYTKKSRIKPYHMDYDSDGEYYWQESKNICTVCFQNGIFKSLQDQKRLPFTRRDIYYFIDQIFENNELIYMNYFLPNKYTINYYRQDIPTKLNERLYLILPNK